jgi:hypothetical protein
LQIDPGYLGEKSPSKVLVRKVGQLWEPQDQLNPRRFPEWSPHHTIQPHRQSRHRHCDLAVLVLLGLAVPLVVSTTPQAMLMQLYKPLLVPQTTAAQGPKLCGPWEGTS